MLNVETIQQAIIKANETVFPGNKATVLFALFKKHKSKKDKELVVSDEPISFDKKGKYKNFLIAWYGNIYYDFIEEIINNAHEDLIKNAPAVIAKAEGGTKTFDRRAMFYWYDSHFSSLTKPSKIIDNSAEIQNKIIGLSANIKNVLINHCKANGPTADDIAKEFAQIMLIKIKEDETIYDDYRTDSIGIENFPADNDNVFLSLAAISLIALIPSDATNEEVLIIKRFKASFIESFNICLKSVESKKVSAQIKTEVIDRVQIWKAGKYWYENARKNGNRFCKLVPDQELIPLAGNLPIFAHLYNRQEKPLMDLIHESSGNLYIIGEGGIGKTTALFSIMRDAYDNNTELKTSEIPLFIELSRANSPKHFKNGVSRFIKRSIQKLLSDASNGFSFSDKQLNNYLSCNNVKPEIVLLLDGLNEVSREELNGYSIADMITREIRYIMENYSNVRVILTSRSEEEMLINKTTSLYLSGIDPEYIKKYLSNKGFAPKRINIVFQNKQLLELLRIPLFLTIYSGIEEEKALLTRGEILHAFFAQKKKNIYSERNRTIEIQDNAYANNSKLIELSPAIQCFILDFIWPAIAWYMVNSDIFQFTKREIQRIIENSLNDITDCGFCGNYAKECFCEYLTQNGENTYTAAKDIERILKKGKDDKLSNITSNICKYLSMQLGIIFINGDHKYQVIHHHIRDYFAALYHINKIKLAVYLYKEKHDGGVTSRSCLSALTESPLPAQISIFIGEALGEFHNSIDEHTSHQDSKFEAIDRTLIQRALNIYKQRLSPSDVKADGFAIWNLFQIIKSVRNELTNVDFSYLNLSICCANGHKLGPNTNLCGSRLSKDFFLPTKHTYPISVVTYSSDEKHLLTASKDGTVKIWDAKSMLLCRTLKEHKEKIHSVEFTPDNNFLLTSDAFGTEIWETNDYQLIDQISGGHGGCISAHFSADGLSIVSSYTDGTIEIVEKKDCSQTFSFRKQFTFANSIAKYSPDGRYLLIYPHSEGRYINILDANTLEELYILELYSTSDCTMVSPSFDLSGKVLFVGINFIPFTFLDGDIPHIDIYDMKTGEKHCINLELKESFTTIAIELNHFELTKKMHGFVSAFNPLSQYNGKNSFIAFEDKTIYIFNAYDCSQLESFECHKELSSAYYSPMAKYIITVFIDGTASIWNSQFLNKVFDLDYYDEDIVAARFSPNEDYLAVESLSRTISIWDCENLSLIKEVGTLKYPPETAYWSEQGKSWNAKTTEAEKVLSANTEWAHTFDLKAYIRAVLNGHKDEKYKANIRSNTEYNIDSSGDNTFRIYEVQYNAEKKDLCFPLICVISDIDEVVFADINKEKTHVLTVSKKHYVKAWEMKNLTEYIDLSLFGKVRYVQFSPKGNYIVTVAFDGSKIEFWDAKEYQYISGIELVPGLDIWGLDLTSLDNKSDLLSFEDCLSQHGAIIYSNDSIHHKKHISHIKTDILHNVKNR